jgi:hypothetical protein
MRKYICILAGAALLVACEQKETTVNPPAGEKKESNTTIVNPSPATSSKTETESNTTINTSSPSSESKTETTTTTSPSP